MKKIKILYLITKEDVGGAQKYVKDLAEHLDKNRFETQILTGGKNGVRFLSNAFMPYFLFLNDALAILETFLKLRKIKPDVVHLNSSKAGVIGAIATWLYKKTLYPKPYTLNPKIIFTAHGWVFNPDNKLGFLRRRFYILMHKIAAFFQDKIINVSEYDRKLAIKHKIAPENKLITIHNGIDYQNLQFLDKQTARKTLVRKLKIDHWKLEIDQLWIGSIGRLVKEKNYEDFVKAAALVKNPNARFFIIGDGYERRNLESGIRNLGLENKFFIIENLTPAAPYLKALDIFILSSVKEGLPYTLLEAMAAERPIITTRVGGMTEIMENNGLVIVPKEPQELTRAVDYLLENPEEAKRYARSALEFSKRELNISQMLEKTEKVYLAS